MESEAVPAANQSHDLEEADANEHESTVSVIVPTFNRADRLRSVCEPLLGDPALTELIIVIDGSTDHTDSVVDQLRDLDHRVRSIRIENAGVGAARQAGVVAASADVVLFIDDDVIGDEGLVSRHAARHAEADDLVVVGYMPTRVADERSRGDIFTRLYAREYDRRARTWETDPPLVLEHLWQGNVSVRSRHLVGAPVHDPRFGYSYHEDQYFGWRLRDQGLIGVFDRSLSATHMHRIDINGFRRIARRRGAGNWIAERGELDEVRGLPRHQKAALDAMSLSGIAVAGLLASVVAAIAGLAGRLRWWSAEKFSVLVLRRIELWRGERLARRHHGWLPEWGPVR